MTAAITIIIKVWVKVGNNEPDKVEIRSDSDIDDLKNELFNRNKEEKRKYYGIFNNTRLSSSSRVPHETTSENPILFVKIDENDRENDNDEEDIFQVTADDLSAVPNGELTATTPVTALTQNVNEITLPNIPSMTTTTPINNTTVSYLPPHLIDTIHYKNGDKYTGEINEKREPNGKGTMCWKNGRRYEGQWTNGKKNGQGIEYGANGQVNLNGEWKDDVFVSVYNSDDRRRTLDEI
ncbi:unnamed protein product [Rotaria sp. Silwood1]|nr:unnamed protein product [Rotaria sp. Silwood1]CAF4675884.1 unnamed protein product [Rotaria sp. Silwood1]